MDRRFQLKGAVRGVTVVDDYGHHPTEIRATLSAARESGFRRVHVIFQPHRYTRTRDLMAEFATAFNDADTVQILDIYAASEEPIAGVDATALVRAIGRKEVQYAASFEEAVAVPSPRPRKAMSSSLWEPAASPKPPAWCSKPWASVRAILDVTSLKSLTKNVCLDGCPRFAMRTWAEKDGRSPWNAIRWCRIAIQPTLLLQSA